MVVAEHDLGAHVDGGGEGERLPDLNLVAFRRLHVRMAERLQIVVFDRLRVGIVHADVRSLAQQRLRPKGPF